MAVKTAKCLRTMRLMDLANMMLEEAKLMLLKTYPKQLRFDIVNWLEDSKGRASALIVGRFVNKRSDLAAKTPLSTTRVAER